LQRLKKSGHFCKPASEKTRNKMNPSKLNSPSPQKPSENPSGKNVFQLVWGIALFLMGIAVIFRVPAVISRISATGELSSGWYFLRFCFYLIAVILIGGGIRKINQYRLSTASDHHDHKKE
jgi:hypothetical protein